MGTLKFIFYLQKYSMNFSEWRPRLMTAWLVHFLASIIMLVFSSINKDSERKYIPIDVEKIDQDCYKGFVDVFSPSMDSPGALICCNLDPINPRICNPPPSYLLFSRRLARFPDAWLLPLFPLFVRVAFQFVRGSEGDLQKANTKMRLYLYIILIQIRGWILYVVFDTIEEMIVSSVSIECWYGDLLQYDSSGCYGQVTDFSDHVVLYFAQILPLALTEVLHSFATPYWKTKNSFRDDDTIPKLIPALLLFWLANLYTITCIGAYKTALYFHTGREIFVGYLVSLLIQIPLFLMQCTSFFPRARMCFFGYSQS